MAISGTANDENFILFIDNYIFHGFYTPFKTPLRFFLILWAEGWLQLWFQQTNELLSYIHFSLTLNQWQSGYYGNC